MKTPGRLLFLPLLLIAFSFAACRGDNTADRGTTQGNTTTENLRVTEVDLGTSVDANRRVTADTDDFRPTDTVYASVSTTGSASGATLTARWTYQDGQVVDETSQTISPTGPANTEFHISMPEGLPTGDYEVEILLNGQRVETESFEVH